jgi:hypothetical protein
MSRLIHIFTAISLAIGGIAFLGCEQTNRPATQPVGTAGGNGMYGESPDQPGQYGAPQTAQPSNAGITPRQDQD